MTPDELINSGYRLQGPYLDKNTGRKILCLYKDKNNKRSVSYSKWLLCQATKTSIDTHLTCDHIDEDYTNDNILNLQWLTLVDNAKKHAFLKKKEAIYQGICPECGDSFSKLMRYVKHNINLGKSGPYCSRSCAGKASHVNHWGQRQDSNLQKPEPKLGA